MKAIESVSCIRFIHVNDSTKDYIRIRAKPTGCHSDVGYSGTEQFVNLEIAPLGEGCFKMGTIVHELLHVLGFFHQHSVPERDNYVRILYENIKDNMAFNFRKLDANTVNDFGVAYDYGSVMHYGSKSFSKNGLDTIVPLGGDNIKIGQRVGMSESDILRLNRMYNC